MPSRPWSAAGWRRWAARAAAVAGLASAATASATPEITWYLYDLPPFVILDGPRKGEGFVERTLRNQLIPGLPGYQHKIMVVPLQRLSQMLKTDPNACNPALLKNPEREQFMTFSTPYLAVIPGGAFIRRSDAARLTHYVGSSGKLNLSKLLEDGRLTVGIDSARSYGATVDGVLKPFKGRSNVFGLSTPEASKSLVQMVAGGRIDLVLAQPFEVPYYFSGKDNAQSKGLQFYRLAEQTDYVLNHAACAKGEFGRNVIRQIDALWARPGVRAAVFGLYSTWLDDDARQLAQRLQNEAFAGAAQR